MCEAARQRSQFVRDLEESRQSDAAVPRGQVVRPKLDPRNVGHRRLDCKLCRERPVNQRRARQLSCSSRPPFRRWGRHALAWTVRLFARELALAGNALVRFGCFLDPILKFAAPLGQLPRYDVSSATCIPICEVWSKCDLLAGLKLVLWHVTLLLAYVHRHASSLKDSVGLADQHSRLRGKI